ERVSRAVEVGWSRLRSTPDDAILAGVVAVVAPLLVVAVSTSGLEQASRPAVRVEQLPAAYHGAGGPVEALKGGDARASALARADLDSDGAPDLVVGYGRHGTGMVTVQRGNEDAPELVHSSALVVRVP